MIEDFKDRHFELRTVNNASESMRTICLVYPGLVSVRKCQRCLETMILKFLKELYRMVKTFEIISTGKMVEVILNHNDWELAQNLDILSFYYWYIEKLSKEIIRY